MEDLIYQGVVALKNGDKTKARSLLLSALEKNNDSAQAWLWLSGAVDSEADQLDCLQQVLRIDPSNEVAAKGVAVLKARGVLPSQPAEEELPAEQIPEEEQEPLSAETEPGEEEELPAGEIVGEGQELPAAEMAPVEEEAPTEEVTAEEQEIPTAEIAQVEEEMPTGEVTEEEPEIPTAEMGLAEEEELPAGQVTAEEPEIPTAEMAPAEEEEQPVGQVAEEEQALPAFEEAEEPQVEAGDFTAESAWVPEETAELPAAPEALEVSPLEEPEVSDRIPETSTENAEIPEEMPTIVPEESPEPVETQENIPGSTGLGETFASGDEFTPGMDTAVEDAAASLEGAGTTLEGSEPSIADMGAFWEEPSESKAPVTEAETGVEVPPMEEKPPAESITTMEGSDAIPEGSDTSLQSVSAEDEDAFKLPDSFFEPVEEGQSEDLPDWLVNPVEESGTPAAQVATYEESEETGVTAQSDQALIAFPETSEPAAEVESEEVQTPVPAEAETEKAEEPHEQILFKIRPSLITPVLVYGLASVILFLASIGLLVLVPNVDTLPMVAVLGVVIVLLVVMLIVFISAVVSHLMASYTVTNRRLYLVQGVISIKPKSIPLDDVQGITLEQGVLQKIFGIGHLDVLVNTREGGEITFRLMDVPKAKRAITRIEGALSEDYQ